MFIIVTLLAITGLINTDLIAPALPSIGISFQQSANHTQYIITLFLLGFALSQLVYGPLSDRVGRKIPLIVGMSIYTLGSFLCIFAHSLTALILFRTIQGIGVGSGLSLARVVLRDCYRGTELAVKTAQIAIFISLAPALAPFIGGIIQQHFNFVGIFITMTIYGLILLFLLASFFRETHHQKNKTLTWQTVIQNYQSLFRHVEFLRYVFIAGLAFSSIILYVNILPFIIQQQLNLSALQNGWILLFAALGLSIGSFVSSRLVKKLGADILVRSGLWILLISGLLLITTKVALAPHLLILIPLIFAVTIACGFIFPNALALAFNLIDFNIGIAGALYGAIQITISMFINLVLNAIPHQDQILLGVFYLFLGCIGLIVLTLPKISRGLRYCFSN